MGRTRLSPQRLVETKKTNIGHIIIFCEGKTEKYYFEYFAQIVKKNKYTDVEVVLESANGDARSVLQCAEEFFTDGEHNRKYGAYGRYLAFDCDAPPNIQSVILAAKDYTLLLSNHLFETWLLMHFEDLEEKITKRETYRRLENHLRRMYKKGRKGITREIIQNGSVEKAIDCAKRLEQRYAAEGKNMFVNIADMNPYTSVYTLAEQLMLEIS